MSEAEDTAQQEAGELTLEQQIAQGQQQAFNYILISAGLVVAPVLLLVIVLFSMALAKSGIEAKMAETSGYRLHELSDNIGSALKKIRREHEDNKAYLKEFELLPFTQRYAGFYHGALNGEKALGQYISHYQVMTYDAASQVRGSGEWHSFYNSRLDYFLQRSQNRHRYLKQLAPPAPVTEHD